VYWPFYALLENNSLKGPLLHALASDSNTSKLPGKTNAARSIR